MDFSFNCYFYKKEYNLQYNYTIIIYKYINKNQKLYYLIDLLMFQFMYFQKI